MQFPQLRVARPALSPAPAPARIRHPRTTRPRTATDALKMGCPFCGSSESSVLRSWGSITADKVRRRRECSDCGRRFPTTEHVDRPCLERELDGVQTPHGAGALRMVPTWKNAERLLQRLSTGAGDVKADWILLHRVLFALEHAPPVRALRP